jgi:isoleucyl-tRNA synthetase
LCDWPTAHETIIDKELLEEMSLVREIVALGRSARASERLKVRQPLSEVELILANKEKAKILSGYVNLIAEELNVKNVKFVTEARDYVDYVIKPNFKLIGPKFGPLAPKIKIALSTINGGESNRQLTAEGKFSLSIDGQSIDLTREDVEIGLSAHSGFAAAQGPDVLVVLKTEITEELRAEGLSRELIHHIQQLRKDMDLPYEARIELWIDCPDELKNIISNTMDYIKSESLAVAVTLGQGSDAPTKEASVEEYAVKIWMRQMNR